jgi:hypothetical protein
MLVAEQFRKRRRDNSRSFSIRAKQLAEFLNSSEVKENVLAQRLKDLEARPSSGASGPCQAKSLADDHLDHSANVQENGEDSSNHIIEIYGEFQG